MKATFLFETKKGDKEKLLKAIKRRQAEAEEDPSPFGEPEITFDIDEDTGDVLAVEYVTFSGKGRYFIDFSAPRGTLIVRFEGRRNSLLGGTDAFWINITRDPVREPLPVPATLCVHGTTTVMFGGMLCFETGAPDKPLLQDDEEGSA